MTIACVETSGEAPGWIHRHSAELADNGRSIVVRGGEVWVGADRRMQENIDAWSLDVESGSWSRLTALDWQRWTMVRVDRKRNRLWDLRQELWHREHALLGLESYWRHDDEPDFEALAALYRLDPQAPAQEQGGDHNVYRKRPATSVVLTIAHLLASQRTRNRTLANGSSWPACVPEPASWSGDAPAAIGRPLWAAYLPVHTGGRATGPDPKRQSARRNCQPGSGRPTRAHEV